jgi:hypothetical protein
LGLTKLWAVKNIWNSTKAFKRLQDGWEVVVKRLSKAFWIFYLKASALTGFIKGLSPS